MQRWINILKKILLITVSTMGVVVFTLLITSAIRKQNTLLCRGIKVQIQMQNGGYFVNEKDVADRVHFLCGDSIQKLKLASLNLHLIEEDLQRMDFIDSVEVFFNQNQFLEIHVKQKRPILRIINNNGVSYYLTDKNQTMPLSHNFTARLPVVVGKVQTNESANRDSLVQWGLFKLMTTMEQDSFLSAFIDHIVIDANGEIELIPLTSEHSVFFGYAHENTEKKLQRLKTFYKEVMPRKGWSTYKTVNMKFENQIVCVKRELLHNKDSVANSVN
jgi:cell division protein FtsQ